MNLTQVILGDIVTEKAERLKAMKVRTLRVHPKATKIDISNALRKHYGVEPVAIRIVKIRSKSRLVGRGRSIRKRGASKRALVTLSAKSKALDLSHLQS